MDTKTALEDAIRARAAAIDPDEGPVLAWTLVFSADGQGAPEPPICVEVPDGQRGFITHGLLADAADVMRGTFPRTDE